MRKNCVFSLITTLALASTPVLASETRVDSTGGLSLVIQDASAEVNPFNIGNPAGLVLLPTENRFDLSTPWFQQSPASNTFLSTQAYGVLSQLTGSLDNSSLLAASTNSFQYEGLILFPTPQWAFQGSGDLLHATNQPDNSGISGLMDQSLDRTRGLGRTAYDFGPFSLGAQFQLGQYNFTVQPVSFGSTSLVSGNISETLMIPAVGLLANLPLESRKDPATLRIGGSFTMILPSAKDIQHFSLDYSGTPVTVDQIITVSSYQNFGPEIYLNIPGSLQAVVLDYLENTSLSSEKTSSNTAFFPSQPSFHLNTESKNSTLGLFKWHFPVLISSKGVLNLNQGAYLLVDSKQNTFYDPAGNISLTSTTSDIQAGIGTGLAKDKDFTVGLQAALETQTGNNTPASNSPQSVNFFGYHVSVGGERWLSRSWAFRTGITFESDRNQGSQALQRPYYFIPSGTQIISTTLTVGAGYQDPGLQTDLRFWYGQPSVYDSPNPNDFATYMGAQLSLSILFH